MSTVSYANGHGSVQQVGISVVQAYAPQIGIEGVPPEMMNVITSASSSAAVAAIQGKPLNEIFSAGLSGSVKGLVMNELSSQGLDVKGFSNKAISDAVGNASNAILNGQSVGDAIAASASRSLVSKGMQETTGALKSTWDNIYKNSETLQDIGSTFNSVKSQAQDAWNNLTSLQSTAQAQVNESNNLLGTLNSQQAQIQELSGRFDEQVRYANDPGSSPQIAGKTFVGGMNLVKAYQDVQTAARAEASNLANQINSLNDQATGTLNQFNSVKAGYEDTVSKIAPLQTQLASYNEQLTSLDSQATTLDTQTKDLTASLIDKLKEYQELEKEFGTEIAQQIASQATEELKSQPSTLQIGDTVDTGFGEEVTLADGSRGRITQTGLVEAIGPLSNIIPVVNKTPTGSVTLSNDTESDEIINPGNVTKPELTPKEVYESYLKEGFSEERAREASEYTPSIDDEKDDFRVPVDTTPTPPLSTNPADEKSASDYFDALIAQGIEPALATKMSGHTPAGTNVLPVTNPDGSPTGTPTGQPDGTPDGTPTGTPDGTPDGTGTATSPITPPLTPPTTPTAPDLTAGELIVEGTTPKPYEPFESDFPIQPEETPPTTPTTPVKTPTTAVGIVTSPKTPTKGTTSTTTKPTGALPTTIPTATDSSFSMPSTGTQATPAVTAPLSISATSLAGAPVYNNNPQLLAELKQMYPQLSTLNPKLLNMLGASPKGTPPLSQSAQVAQAQNQNDLMTNFMGKGISTDLDLPSFADGGHIHGMEYGQSPKFITGATGHYVKGAGDGQSDDIPALLADGEYVFDADTVAQLGNGSSDAGAKFLDHFRQAVREHKRSAPVDKIPPKASPLEYMKEALKRHSKG
jgi:predicted  nucleic acid-binding Zn-ribbon protein